MSCPAQYPYVNKQHSNYCCSAQLDAVEKLDNPSVSIDRNDPENDPLCTQRDCKDAKGDLVPCVNNTRADGTGMLNPSQMAGAGGGGGPPTSFVEMDESACQSFTSLLERVQKTHGKKAKLSLPPNCHQARTDLQNEFKEAFKVLGHLYNEEIYTMEENRTICLNEATYDYKASVEGIDGIDDQIQDAAGKIHEAQGEIARLEPMLHDVERAVDRMRTYVNNIRDKCGEEQYIGHLYEG